jgi:hypothetical protein
MTRLDWWLGILLLVSAIVAHAAMNRYSWHLYSVGGQGQNARALVKIDRFTGAVTHDAVPPVNLYVLREQWKQMVSEDEGAQGSGKQAIP